MWLSKLKSKNNALLTVRFYLQQVAEETAKNKAPQPQSDLGQLPGHHPLIKDGISDDGLLLSPFINSSLNSVKSHSRVCFYCCCFKFVLCLLYRGCRRDSSSGGRRSRRRKLGQTSGSPVAEQTSQPEEGERIQPTDRLQTSILLYLPVVPHVPAGNWSGLWALRPSMSYNVSVCEVGMKTGLKPEPGFY